MTWAFLLVVARDLRDGRRGGAWNWVWLLIYIAVLAAFINEVLST